MFWYPTAVTAAGVGLALWCTPAIAAGGKDIASAPSVVYGQQEFGNTGVDDPGNGFCPLGSGNGGDAGQSWWLLAVTAGDKVTIDFAGAEPGVPEVAVYPVGTNDFNVQLQNLGAPTGEDSKAEYVFSAGRTGTMPLQFINCGDNNGTGPYNFTAYVAHKLVASLAAAGSSHRNHQTRFTVGVHNPDGVVVHDPAIHATVQVLAHHKWVTQTTVPAPGTAVVKWSRAERGKTQSVRVQLTGSGYLTASSQTLRVKGV